MSHGQCVAVGRSVVTFTLCSCHIDLEEFPQEEREPVSVKEGQGAVLLCAPPKAWPRMCTRPPFTTSLWLAGKTSFATFAFSCHRGGDLPMDLQRVSTLPAHGSPPLRLPEDGEPVHLQSGGSGCRQLLLLRFKSRHREERLLQVHPSHPSSA